MDSPWHIHAHGCPLRARLTTFLREVVDDVLFRAQTELERVNCQTHEEFDCIAWQTQDEFQRVLWQAAELEAAMKLHQARMKDVCHSIKAHYHWVHYAHFFPKNRKCQRCGDSISPEFAFCRHNGFGTLREEREAAAAAASYNHDHMFEGTWV